MTKQFFHTLCYIFIVLIAVPSICLCANDAQPMSGLVYGDGYSFWLDAPKGWVLDPKTAKQYGINVVLYQAGLSFQTGPAVMYTSKLTRAGIVEEAMKHEADNYKEKYKGIQISRRLDIQTKDNKIARVLPDSDPQN